LRESKVAKRYAKALLSLGREDGQYEQYGQNLREFSEFCRSNTEFGRVMSNQVFSVEDRKKILGTVLAKSGFSSIVMNFLNLLLDKNRINVIQGITEYYESFTDEISNLARAQVMVSSPLKGDAKERLVKALERLTSKRVKMEVREDKSLIGGLVVKIGDLVLDGSVKAQLEGLKESLKRGEYS
jgi:F-type H+-transporting ATPase subunit delta